MGCNLKCLAFGLVTALFQVSHPAGAQGRPPYLDPNEPLEKRLDDIAARLALPEKIALLSTTAAPVDRLQISAFNGFNQSLHGVVWTRPTTTFPVPIDPRDLATWDEQAKGWALEAGNYEVMVGSSSSDIRLRAQFQIGKRGKWSDCRQDSSPC